LDTPVRETTTADLQSIIVESYAVWAIAEPGTFFVRVQDEDNAEITLGDLLRNAQNSVIGNHSFSEFVNTDPGKIRFEQIENEIAAEVRDIAMQEYGIAVKAVGIKRLNVPKDVTEKVFDRMKADRNRKKVDILAEGNAAAKSIRSDAEAKQKELLAVAAAQAQLIRGTGDAEAAKYYEMLKEDPELAMFLRNLEALKKILAEKTTIVLGVETEPIDLLKGVPDIEPK
jgi:membrane protease subunit HflC